MPGRRIALATALATVLTAPLAVLAGAPEASAATTGSRPVGRVAATQDTFDHRLSVRGYAYDPAHPAASIPVRLYGNGRYLATVRADLASANVNRARHLTGRHAFAYTTSSWTVRQVTITTSAGSPLYISTTRAAQVQPAAGQRIVTLAKRYVGKARYVAGGSSPKTGFDCSGYTAYIYAQAKVARLPHDAEGQRHVKGMRAVSAKKAQPGDLIFYFSGGPAYHVAIYAGHGMQYAAATERDGIRYQPIWSKDIEFRHYG